MEPLTMMFISSIIGSLLPAIMSGVQQKNEFGQQNQLLDAEQQFQRDREDLAYQRSLPSTQYQNFLDAGFNPNLAAESILGGNGQTVSAGSSPSAPNVNSAIDAIASSLNQGSSQLYDSMFKQAQIKNLDANTDKTEVEAGIMPRELALKQMTALEQFKVWDKSVEKMASEIGLTEEQKKLVSQQVMYYGKLSDKQIELYQSQIAENVSQAKQSMQKIRESQKYMEVMDEDIQLKKAETSNFIQDTSNKVIEGEYTYEKSERERIAKEFEAKCSGIPLTADAQRYVATLANDGKWDEVKQFYNAVFMSALNQSVGMNLGKPNTSIGLPFGIFRRDTYESGGQLPFEGDYGRGIPYWTPPK